MYGAQFDGQLAQQLGWLGSHDGRDLHIRNASIRGPAESPSGGHRGVTLKHGDWERKNHSGSLPRRGQSLTGEESGVPGLIPGSRRGRCGVGTPRCGDSWWVDELAGPALPAPPNPEPHQARRIDRAWETHSTKERGGGQPGHAADEAHSAGGGTERTTGLLDKSHGRAGALGVQGHTSNTEHTHTPS